MKLLLICIMAIFPLYGMQHRDLYGEVLAINGPVGCGKTKFLINQAHIAMEFDKKILAFKHVFDIDRTHNTALTSHDNDVLPAYAVLDDGSVIDQLLSGETRDIGNIDSFLTSSMYDTVVLFDEIQFYYEPQCILRTLIEYAKKGAKVFIAGLSEDFARRTENFSFWLRFLSLYSANYSNLIRFKTLAAKCSVIDCNVPALHSQRLINGFPARDTDPVIMIGGTDLYEPRCYKHHVVLSYNRNSV